LPKIQDGFSDDEAVALETILTILDNFPLNREANRSTPHSTINLATF
jgi:hypothetical protein